MNRSSLGSIPFFGPALAFGADKPAPLAEPLGLSGLLQTFAALILVLLLFAALVYLLRRFGRLQQGASGVLRVLGGVSVGQRERVVLMQVGEQQVLLGVAPGRVQTLHVLEQPVSLKPEAGQGEESSFAERLAAAIGRGGKAQ